MKFGLDIQSNERVEPKTGLVSKCQSCSELLIAKCGDIRIHHWAHKSRKHCDVWWEPETEWHRTWKNLFPATWQEIIKFDRVTGEKHIADVYNSDKDIVLEFQNSPIEMREVISRENFYKRMIWVINAQKFKLSISQIQDATRYSTIIKNKIEQRIKLHKRKVNDMIFDKNVELDLELKRVEMNLIRGRMEEKDANEKRTDILKRILRNSEDIEKENLFVLPPSLQYYKDSIAQILQYTTKNQKLNSDEHYTQYQWHRKPKAWNYAESPIFLDVGNSLIWIVSPFIAKRIKKQVFLKKYGDKV